MHEFYQHLESTACKALYPLPATLASGSDSMTKYIRLIILCPIVSFGFCIATQFVSLVKLAAGFYLHLSVCFNGSKQASNMYICERNVYICERRGDVPTESELSWNFQTFSSKGIKRLAFLLHFDQTKKKEKKKKPIN